MKHTETQDNKPAQSSSWWRDPLTDPPTKTGKILVWLDGAGPAVVNVEERWMCFWDGDDETDPTSPGEWAAWGEIIPPSKPTE